MKFLNNYMSEEKDLFSEKKDSKFAQDLVSFILILIAAFLIRSFLVEPFYVPSGSMRSTLLEGDYVVTTKYNYGFSNDSFSLISPKLFKGRVLASQPKRGDIVVFKNPDYALNTYFVKRVIGLPGDKIQVKDSQVYINGQAIKREFADYYISEDNKEYLRFLETLPNGVQYYTLELKDEDKSVFAKHAENTGIYYVPKNKFFMMGDNRDESNDSRAQLGMISFDNLVGKPQLIFFSTPVKIFENGFFTLQIFKNFVLWFHEIRFSRLFNNLYNLENTKLNQKSNKDA